MFYLSFFIILLRMKHDSPSNLNSYFFLLPGKFSSSFKFIKQGGGQSYWDFEERNKDIFVYKKNSVPWSEQTN